MRRRTLLAGLLAAAAAPAGAARAAPITVSPKDLPFVPVDVAGRTLNALIASGTAQAVQLSGRMAASLGGRTTLPSLTVAGHAFTDAPARVSPDIERLAQELGVDFDMIIGWPLLAAEGFALDFPKRILTLGEPPPRAPILVLPLTVGAALPVTRGQVEGRAENFLIDTGTPVSSLDVGLANGSPPGAAVVRTSQIGGQLFVALAYRVNDLTTLRRAQGCAAVIGNNVLLDYRVSLRKGAAAIELA